MINKKNEKSGQEEMVGFALIVIIVAVILLVIIGFSLNKGGKKEAVQSYEADSFIQSVLQYTSNCSVNGYLSTRDLISNCNSNELCDDNEKTCDVLNSSLKDIVNKSWDIGKESPYKGYELIINAETQIVLNITKGNLTNSYKGGFESFAKRGDTYEINFRVYY